MNSLDEFVHQVRQHAAAQMGDGRLHAWGHIASYDPVAHAVQVLLPTRTSVDGEPVMTPWIQLGTVWAGKGANGQAFGFQAAPHGGATADDPSVGEQCLVEIIERRTGASVAAYLFYNNAQPAPAPALAPGEAVFVHETGAKLHFKASGDVVVIPASGKQIMLGEDGLTELDGLVHGSSTDPLTGMTYTFLGSTTKDHLRGKK